jgi:hypothetical protein
MAQLETKQGRFLFWYLPYIKKFLGYVRAAFGSRLMTIKSS